MYRYLSYIPSFIARNLIDIAECDYSKFFSLKNKTSARITGMNERDV